MIFYERINEMLELKNKKNPLGIMYFIQNISLILVFNLEASSLPKEMGKYTLFNNSV